MLSMEEILPHSLILDILNRLNDSADLARCRVASNTLNCLSKDVRSINLVCTLSRYLKSRSPATKHQVTPFKAIFHDLVRNSQKLESISIRVDESLGEFSFDDVDDESDDLHLTEARFVKSWLPRVCDELKSLSILDFWIQSCWRKSEVLALISSCCHRLLELKVKNAWLLVEDLTPMPMLTKLTLEFIRLEDENLSKVNDCFPCLQVLNLIGVGGLKQPEIHLLHLRTCRWTVSNAPHSLAIYAPNLVKLELQCIKPESLVLEAPLLNDFHLSLEKTNDFRVKEFQILKNLKLESSSLCGLIDTFPFGNTIQKLKLDSLKSAEPIEIRKFDLGSLFNIFPNMSSLALGPKAWSEAEAHFRQGGLKRSTGMKELKEIIAHLVVDDIDVTLSFILCILNKCISVSHMALLIHREVDSHTASKLISGCAVDHPRVRWRWGIWKEGTEDNWVSAGI